MNWLMYIGGGIIFLSFCFYLHCILLRLIFFKRTVTKITLSFKYFIAPLMVWIWICWRFIRHV